MAIASLFGTSPEEIILARQKELRDQQMLRNQQITQQGGQFGLFAPLYQAGLRFGDIASQSIMQGLFPRAQDPMLQRATTTQSIIQKYQGQDFNDPAVLNKMAQEFSASGQPEIAMQLGDRARSLAPKLSRTVVAPGASVIDEQGKVLYTAPKDSKTTRTVVSPGASVIDEQGKLLFTAPKDRDIDTKILTPGAILVDSGGNIIAQGREQKAEPKVSAEWTRYQELLGLGVPREEARSIAYKTNTLDFRKDLEEARKAEQNQRKEALVETTVRTIDNVMTTIDTASKQIGTFTAGAIGSPLSLIPGTPAKNLAANLETIKANLGFDRLQQMRDASPTGGALGQVAIQELVALQASIASLDIQQTPAQLRANLNKIKGHYEKWRSAVNKAKEQGAEIIRDRVSPSTTQQQPSGVRRFIPETGRVE